MPTSEVPDEPTLHAWRYLAFYPNPTGNPQTKRGKRRKTRANAEGNVACSQVRGAPNRGPQRNSQDPAPRASGTPYQGMNLGGQSTLSGPSPGPPRGQPWGRYPKRTVDVRETPRETQRSYYLAAAATIRPPYRDYGQRHQESDIWRLENSFRNEWSLNKVLGILMEFRDNMGSLGFPSPPTGPVSPPPSPPGNENTLLGYTG